MIRVQRLPTLAFLLCLAAVSAIAADAAITLDGETFSKKFVASPPSGDRLIEYVREPETFEKWTKLIAFRFQQLPGIANDPRRAANEMAQALKAKYPNAPFRVIANEKTSEALIDFLLQSADGKFMEFNVWRFAKSTSGNGVVSLQLAYRFTDASTESTERLKKIRASWIDQAVAYDMDRVRKELGQ